jgi:predicted transcriptional regulator of viral defense system
MSSIQSVRNLLANGEALAIEDFSSLDLSRATLFRALQTLVANGEVQRVQHGCYQQASISDGVDPWVLATRAVPDGVLCLLSALAFHELGTQLPADVWLALPKSAYRPQIDYPPIRFVHFSDLAFSAGQEEHLRTGGVVRVYSVAKTLADCFKFRNRIGVDVAVEALKDAVHQRRTTINELMAMARVCRVQAVMAPYVETIAAH